MPLPKSLSEKFSGPKGDPGTRKMEQRQIVLSYGTDHAVENGKGGMKSQPQYLPSPGEPPALPHLSPPETNPVDFGMLHEVS
jgi:hypothetical protein